MEATTLSDRRSPRRLALQAMTLCLGELAVAMAVGLLFHKPFLLDNGMKMLSLVVIAFLYLSHPGTARAVLLREPSAAAIGWSLAGFCFALVASRSWSVYGLLLAVMAGLFVRVTPEALVEEMKKDRRATVVILLAAFSGPLLALTRKFLWMPLAQGTAWLMALILSPFYDTVDIATRSELLQRGDDILPLVERLTALGMTFPRRQTDYVLIATEDMYMKISAFMNLSNGLALLAFALGVALLLGLPLHRQRRLRRVYALAALFVMLANALWLSLVYMMLPPRGHAEDAVGAALRQLISTGSPAVFGWLGYALLCATVLGVLWHFSASAARPADA